MRIRFDLIQIADSRLKFNGNPTYKAEGNILYRIPILSNTNQTKGQNSSKEGSEVAMEFQL